MRRSLAQPMSELEERATDQWGSRRRNCNVHAKQALNCNLVWRRWEEQTAFFHGHVYRKVSVPCSKTKLTLFRCVEKTFKDVHFSNFHASTKNCRWRQLLSQKTPNRKIPQTSAMLTMRKVWNNPPPPPALYHEMSAAVMITRSTNCRQTPVTC